MRIILVINFIYRGWYVTVKLTEKLVALDAKVTMIKVKNILKLGVANSK